MEQANNNNTNVNRRAPGNRSAAFDPRNPSLVQPYKRLVEEGFITELNVKFTPWGVVVNAKPDERLAALGDQMQVNIEYPVGKLVTLAESGNLIPLKGKKGKKNKSGATTEQPLPEKSLCKKDFQGTAAELSARAVAVANKAGGSSLIGRVRSAGNFRMGVTTSFQDWWSQASVEDKSSALIQPRYRDGLTADDYNKLSGLQCPFRGTAEFTVDVEVEESEAEEETKKVTTTPTTAKVLGAAATAAQKARTPSPNKK